MADMQVHSTSMLNYRNVGEWVEDLAAFLERRAARLSTPRLPVDAAC
jgi:hypothetical protein